MAKSSEILEGTLDAKGMRFAIVVPRFNDIVAERLLAGAVDCLDRHGADPSDRTLVRVPGSWEVALVAHKMAADGKHDAVIALGALVRGETPHFDMIAGSVTRSLAQSSVGTGVPILFGILTTDTLEQALSRAGAKAGNKGWETALSAIEMVSLYRRMA